MIVFIPEIELGASGVLVVDAVFSFSVMILARRPGEIRHRK